GDGEGQVFVSGGMPPYNVQWSGQVSGSITLNADGDFIIANLTAGVYTVQVEDDAGCVVTCSFTITANQPCFLVIDEILVQDASCAGVDNGQLDIIAIGGT